MHAGRDAVRPDVRERDDDDEAEQHPHVVCARNQPPAVPCSRSRVASADQMTPVTSWYAAVATGSATSERQGMRGGRSRAAASPPIAPVVTATEIKIARA